MNPVVVVYLVVAVIGVAVAVPLAWRRVKMNHWYGVRIPAAFESDEAWFDINQYGARLLMVWSFVILATAGVGAWVKRKDWSTYDWAASAVVIAGLLVVVGMIYRYARRRKKG